MIVIVDTSIWSLAFRRKPRDLSPDQRQHVDELKQIITEGRARLLGPVRQELLSGIRSLHDFIRLRDQLRFFPDAAIDSEDYEQAARIGNNCRSHGVAVTAIDMLLCAVALRWNWAIYTSYRDFQRYSKHVPVILYG
jgi:predicted nucleic acid-binding protein